MGKEERCYNQSPPARVAWIETMDFLGKFCLVLLVATREGGVDRNVENPLVNNPLEMSPPARVAWIETCSGWH